MIRRGEIVNFKISGEPRSAVIDQVVFRGVSQKSLPHRELLILKTTLGSYVVRDRAVLLRDGQKQTETEWHIYSTAAAYLKDTADDASSLDKNAASIVRQIDQAVRV